MILLEGLRETSIGRGVCSNKLLSFCDDVTYINGVDFSQLVTNDSRLDRLLMPTEQGAFVLNIFFASARSN